MDWEEFVPARDLDEGQVIVPLTDNPLSQEQFTAVCESFDPLSMLDNFDCVDVYCDVC